MKSGFIIILFMLGTLICATYAAPASSEIQQDDDSDTSKEELLKLLNHLATSQQNDDDEENAKMQFKLGKLFSKGLKLFKRHRKGILKGGGRLLGGALGGYMNGGYGGGGYGGGGYGGYGGGYEAANRQERVSKMQQDNDDEENAKMQFKFGRLFSKVGNLFKKHKRGIFKGGGRLLGGVLSGYMNGGGGYERQEQALEAQEDDDGEDTELQAHSEALSKLEDLIAKQQDNEDEDALAEIEEQNSDLITSQDGDDSLAKSTQDADDDAELQGRRRRRWRGRRRRRRRGRGRRGRGRRGRGRRGRGRKGRKGGRIWGNIGNLVGGLLGGGMGGGCPPTQPMGGGYPPTHPMGGGYRTVEE